MAMGLSEIEAFRQFLDEQISGGRTDLTPEQSLALWRESHSELAESAAAIRRALAAVDAGEPGKPLREFIDEFRANREIPNDA